MSIREGNKWKTVFKTRYGHFKYYMISFWLTNAPDTFRGYINKILAEKLDIFIILYPDNIFIDTESSEKDYLKAV